MKDYEFLTSLQVGKREMTAASEIEMWVIGYRRPELVVLVPGGAEDMRTSICACFRPH